MRLESALYTSREGIGAHGSAIAAIGDNISNVNTPGFKEQRVEFANLVADGISGGTTAVTESTGSGVKVSMVRSLHTPGAIEPTGRALDAAIDGEGFFVVGSADTPRYTRAGNFSIDASGNLVSGNGSQVLGFTVTDGVPGTTLGAINMLNFDSNATPTSTAAIAGNLNSTSVVGTAPANPATFTELAAASSYVTGLDVVDSLGATHAITLSFTKTAPNTYTTQAYIDGADVGGVAGTPTLLGSVDIAFNATGTIDEANKAAAQIVMTPAYAGGAAAGNITLNLGDFTQYAATSTLGTVTQNGLQSSSLANYEFEDSGNVVAVLSNGERVTIANLALATFNNTDGLQKQGDNIFVASGAAGTADIGSAGTEARGSIQGNALERSTVDLANSFTSLVLMQRGYQANSRIMGTVDQMLDQAISLLR